MYFYLGISLLLNSSTFIVHSLPVDALLFSSSAGVLSPVGRSSAVETGVLACPSYKSLENLRPRFHRPRSSSHDQLCPQNLAGR